MPAALQPETRKLRLADIELADYNPRDITPDALRGLKESLRALTLLEVPVVNVAVDPPRCISGHQRIRGLVEEGFEFVDCIVVEFDEVTEKTANLVMNNPAVQGHWDAEKALPQLESIRKSLPQLDVMGFAELQESIHALLPKDKKLQNRAKDKTPEAPDKAASKKDTIYKLGKHRLACCDIMQPGAVLDLFGRKKAHVCITDPPYNVDYENYSWEGIDNDDMDSDSWAMFLTAMCKTILSVTKGASYVFCASRFLPNLFESWLMNKGEVHQWLMWAKDSWNLTQGDYMHQFDLLLYGGRAGVALPKPNRICSNVFEYPQPKVNKLHPCQKPVELITQMVEDSTSEGQIVFDPFGGSGTALAAAEALGRVCYMAEMSPTHVDTIRMRWVEQVHGEDADWQALTPAI
jgi:DNA modification methylase